VLPLLGPVLVWAPDGSGTSLASALGATLAALDAAAPGSPPAAAAAAGLRAGCPLSAGLTVRLFADAARRVASHPGAAFVDQLAAELPPAARLAGSPHFAEGVRCALVDRGVAPAWPAPASFEALADADVDALLTPLPQGGLRGDYWEEGVAV
jgi:hypothetical protein